MKTMNIDEIVWDLDVYPRQEDSWTKATVERYADAIAAGAEFPPLVLEKKTNRLLDGKHRLEAYKLARDNRARADHAEKKIEAECSDEWIKKWVEENEPELRVPVCFVVVPSDMLVREFAATFSAKHGDRLSNRDLKALARYVFKEKPGLDVSAWGKKFGVSKSMVYYWIQDILAAARADRETKAWRLSQLGWTQEEIGEKLGVDQSLISLDMKDSNIGKIHNSLTTACISGSDWNEQMLVNEAERLGIRQIEAWAAAFEGIDDQTKADDQRRFEKLGWGIRTYDDWSFNACDERFGQPWPGRIPAQLIAHALYFFTKPGAVVMDPMAGGGTVSDTCLVFGRKCFSFDLATSDKRPEIIKYCWNVDKIDFPEFLKRGRGRKIDLVFFDPPYYTKMEEEYKNKEEEAQLAKAIKEEGEEKEVEVEEGSCCISSLDRDKYLNFFLRFLRGIKQYMKPKGRLAFLNADWRDFQSTPALKEKPDKAVTIFDYHDILSKAGWKVTHRISVPLSNARFNKKIVPKMQKKRILGVVTRDLLIAKIAKVEG